MSLIGNVMQWFGGARSSAAPSRFKLPWLKKNPALPREDVLRLRPVRNPVVSWETEVKEEIDSEEETSSEEETGAEEAPEIPLKYVLNLPTRQDKYAKILARMFKGPSSRKVQLDEFGSQIWDLCDGKHTIEELVRFTCQTYKLNRRQGEVSVLAFMRMLSERRLIGYLKKEGDVSHGSPKPRRSKPGRQRRTTTRRPRRH